jgi:hypothetical protein
MPTISSTGSEYQEVPSPPSQPNVPMDPATPSRRVTPYYFFADRARASLAAGFAAAPSVTRRIPHLAA